MSKFPDFTIDSVGLKIDTIFNAFSKELWKNGTILDVGCGSGDKGLMRYFERGVVPSNCTVLDALEDKMLLLKEAGCKCIAADLEENSIITQVSEKFDIIICSHLLEHVTQECEDNLLKDFVEIGSNIVICYPAKPKITAMPRKHMRKKYMHKRKPEKNLIVEYLKVHFEDISTELMNSQIFIIAKGNKHE